MHREGISKVKFVGLEVQCRYTLERDFLAATADI